MAVKRRPTTYQYEPLVTPSKWQGDELRFSVRLTQILDDLYQKFSSLRTGSGSASVAIADDANKLGGIEASEYALKTGTVANANKLGGKAPEYYLSPRNLLDNSDFRNPVNQRGQTSYNSTSMTIDRWEVLSGTFVVNSGYITTGFVQQKMLIGNLTGVHTLAAKRKDGTLLVYSQEITSSYSYTEARPAFGAWGDGLVRITLPAGEYVWAALYEGSYTAETLPPYVPKGYGVELAECQRYYENSWYGTVKTDLYQMIGLCWNGNRFDVPIEFKQQKRAKPTMTYYPSGSRTTIQGFINSAYRDVTILDPEYRMGLRGVYARVGVAESDLTVGYSYQLHAHWEANADL